MKASLQKERETLEKYQRDLSNMTVESLRAVINKQINGSEQELHRLKQRLNTVRNEITNFN